MDGVSRSSRPAAELVLESVRPEPDAARILALAECLGASGGWASAQMYAFGHGVPLIFGRGVEAVVEPPAHLRDALAAERRAAGFRALAATRQSSRLSGLLAEAGIPSLALKGPALGQIAYGDAGLRSYGDIDLLVAEQDLVWAGSLLAAAGIEPLEPLDSHGLRWYLATWRQMPPARGPGDALPLELHGSIHPPYFGLADPPGLWSRAAPLVVDGRSLPAPSPEDAVLIAAAHAMRSGWGRLEWLTSIGWLVARKQLDWELLTALAFEQGSARMLGLGLSLSEHLLGVVIPAGAERLAGRAAGGARLSVALEGALREPVPQEGRYSGGEEPDLGLRLLHLRARERLRDRLAYLARLAFVPTQVDAAVVRLPVVPGRLLYPLVRILRLSAGLIARGRRRR